MAPDWQKLMDEFDGHATKLVGDVDCTAEGKPLCEANEVRGYPTLKYGDPDDLQPYEGGRDLDSLRKHIQEKLVPQCSPSNIALCDDDKKAEITRLQAIPKADLEAQVEAESAKLAKAEADFKSAVEGLQKTYEKLQKDKEATIESIKESGLGLMKAVLKSM